MSLAIARDPAASPQPTKFDKTCRIRVAERSEIFDWQGYLAKLYGR